MSCGPVEGLGRENLKRQISVFALFGYSVYHISVQMLSSVAEISPYRRGNRTVLPLVARRLTVASSSALGVPTTFCVLSLSGLCP